MNELDELLKLTRTVSLAALEPEPQDEDLGAYIYEATMDNRPYTGDDDYTSIEVKGEDDEKKEDKKQDEPEESKSEKTDDKEEKEETEDKAPKGKKNATHEPYGNMDARKKLPIFEEEPEEFDEDNFESILGKGLGLGGGAGISLHKSISNESIASNPLAVGDFVTPREGDGQVILVIKMSDGDSTVACKPTAYEDECSQECCSWPEFCYRPDELERLDEISLADLFNVIKFNDSKTECIVDDKGMKCAQDNVNELTKERKSDPDAKDGEFIENGKLDAQGLSEYMDDICGPMKVYQKETPTYVKENPDGSVESYKSGYKVGFGSGVGF